MVPDLGYGVRWNYETCKSLIQAPGEDTISYYNTTEVAYDDKAGTSPAYGYEPFKGIVIAEKQLKLPIFKPNAIYFKPGMKPTDRKDAILAVYDPVKTLNSCGRVGLPVKAGELPGGKYEDVATYDWGAERGAGVLYPYEIFAKQVKEIAAYKHPLPMPSTGCYNTASCYTETYYSKGDKCCGTSNVATGSVATGNLCKADNKCKNFDSGSTAYLQSNECGAGLTFEACCDSTLSAPAKYCEPTSCDYNPMQCHEDCTITKAEAVAMFKKFVTTHDPCEFAKLNTPFVCVKRAPRSILERISLAYANSLLVFTVFSALCVKIFFASSKKGKETGEEAAASPA